MPSSDTSQSTTLSPAARLLKALVIGMAILIITGLAVVLTVIVQRSNPGPGTTDGLANMSLHFPAGTQVQSVDLEDGRILLHVNRPGNFEELLILDPEKETVKARIRLEISPLPR